MPFSKTTLLIISFICIQSFAQDLKLASDVWPPFTNVEKEKSVAIDIVSEALLRSNISCKNYIVDFDTVLKGIKLNDYNGSAALWKTKQREETMLFSKPYLENQLVLVSRKGTNVSVANFEELNNKKLGLIAGYAYNETITNHKNIEYVYSKNNQQNLEKLLSEEIDYFLVDNLLIQYMLKFQVNDVNKYLSISKKPYATKSLHFAINKQVANAAEIIDLFNKEIKLMMQDGTYNKIMELDWIKVDIDDDGVSELILNGDAVGKEAPEKSYSLFYDESKSNGFYINNKHYPDWESVPDAYKNKIPVQNNQQLAPVGIQIKI